MDSAVVRSGPDTVIYLSEWRAGLILNNKAKSLGLQWET